MTKPYNWVPTQAWGDMMHNIFHTVWYTRPSLWFCSQGQRNLRSVLACAQDRLFSAI